MDSCHIFNFLFGTRKATSELRKCFTGASKDEARCKRQANNNDSQRPESAHPRASAAIQPRQPEREHAINKTSNEQNLIFENPANKLDNSREPAKADQSVESSQQQRINVYDNPLSNAQGSASRRVAATTAPLGTDHQQREQANDNDKTEAREERVKNLIRTFEVNSALPKTRADVCLTPRRLARPPETPPKSTRAKCLNFQLTMRKPISISSLFQDDHFLARHFFDKLAPLDRCAAAQVCRKWRNILYADKAYWRELMGVIDCRQLRREYLAECIMNTLQSARLKHLSQQQQHRGENPSQGGNGALLSAIGNSGHQTEPGDLSDLGQLDQDEIWRIQELCNRYTMRVFSQSLGGGGGNSTGLPNQPHSNRTSGGFVAATQSDQNETNNQTTTTTTTSTSGIANSKSSSSQISSSTLSSISISSLLSPLSESSRVDSLREKLYTTLEERGLISICLFGATDDDIDDLVARTRPNGAQKQLRLARLNNCALTDRGLDTLANTFSQIEELELMGCNEITNGIDLRPLQRLRRLIITDCINIADGLAQRIVEVMHQLETLTIQAYHLTDAFLEFVSLNSDTSQLKRLELPNCKEITNSSALTIAKHFHSLDALSISGSTKINDDGIELLAEHLKSLVSLDLGWLKIGDLSLECLACDLRHLRELVLDRNVHITDLGLGYLATMANLTLLYVRWCPQLTDKSIKSISNMRSLTSLSLAGLHQVTARGILSLLESQQLKELELTNCPAVTSELQQFLSAKMPNCNIIY